MADATREQLFDIVAAVVDQFPDPRATPVMMQAVSGGMTLSREDLFTLVELFITLCPIDGPDDLMTLYRQACDLTREERARRITHGNVRGS